MIPLPFTLLFWIHFYKPFFVFPVFPAFLEELFGGGSLVDNIYRGSCFCIHSASLCLLVEAFNPLTYKVIIDKYDPIAIYCPGFKFINLFCISCIEKML